MFFRLFAVVCVSLVSSPLDAAYADDTTAGVGVQVDDQPGSAEVEPLKELPLADGALTMHFPGSWKQVTPRSQMLEAELKIPATDSETAHGRLTIMRAGGSIDANIQRWEGQFPQADGTATEAETLVEEIEGCTVHLVDISGTYTDSMGGGPFAGGKKVQRDGYRMLAAIIETPELGNYFVKFYGPETLMADNVEAFQRMIRGLQTK